jgi:transcriptional regulator NrdR family protein
MPSKPETCIHCGADSLVIDSRPHPSHRRRVRRCINVVCRHEWTTYESLIDPDDIPPSLAARLSA